MNRSVFQSEYYNMDVQANLGLNWLLRPKTVTPARELTNCVDLYDKLSYIMYTKKCNGSSLST